MSRLVITEKPSVARAYADALGVKNTKDGYIEGNGYVISWCVGHLIELAQPENYEVSLKKWDYDNLPIIPHSWIYEVKKETRTQFTVLKKLMNSNSVTEVICATDAGREGELIFRLVYKMAGCCKPVKRLWLSSMEEKAIRDGFNNLHQGKDYDNLYQSALCRQQADWLVGINGTRLFTVLYNKLLKVGRVQTPTLTMIVEREEAIRSFQKKPFYTTHIVLNGFEAVSDRFDTKDEALNLEACAVFNELRVTKIEDEEKYILPPKLYDLTTLQRDANRIFGFTSKQTLDYTQSLYEKRLCTYPRTDSQFLSDDMAETAASLIGALHKRFLKQPVSAETDIKRILSSKKVTDHHAIIPTMEIEEFDMETLAEGENKVLSLISYRLIAATSGKYIYRNKKVEFDCDGFAFHAAGKTVLSVGFRRYERMLRSSFKLKPDQEEDSEAAKGLPPLHEGQVFRELTPKVIEGFTQPPKSFTEDTLLKYMETAGASEMDDDVERKGLGTPATRADIIEKLVKDGFVRRVNKKLLPTDDGVRLITVLPDVVKSPQMTADWENNLMLVSKGEMRAEAFMAGIRKMITDLIKTYSSISEEEKKMFDSENAVGRCPNCGGDVLVGKYGAYCSEKCGMSLGYAMGKQLDEEQVAKLLEGEKIYMRGLKSKKGGTYNAYLKADGIVPYSYTNKDGEEKSGYQFKFKFEFPKKKKGE